MEINTESIRALAVSIEGAKKSIKKGELVQLDNETRVILMSNHPDMAVHIFVGKIKIGETSLDSLTKKNVLNTLTRMFQNLIFEVTKQPPAPYLNKEKHFFINDNVVQFDN
jgi:hypothetical protein